jgi:hypothetical protein
MLDGQVAEPPASSFITPSSCGAIIAAGTDQPRPTESALTAEVYQIL